jgi:cell division GTPase FtsZ
VVPSNVYELFEPNNHFVIIAGLGGYTGTYMWKHFVKWLTAQQKSFSAIGTLPFSFERKNTQTIVARIQKKMEGKDNCRFIALDTYKENFGNKPLKELFEQVNKDIYSSFKI